MGHHVYDVVTVGGGIAGSSLARSLAEHGVRVLVVERERQFKDRVRGEQMQPWGVAEARLLGIFDLLKDAGGHDQPWIDMFLGRQQIAHRDLSATTPQVAPHFNFFHPRAQETILAAAGKAGAEIWRGVSVVEISSESGDIVVEREGQRENVRTRLVVGADGKFSAARRWRPFEVKQDAPFLIIAGVLLDDVHMPDNTGLIYMNPAVSQGAYLFPQGGGRVRAYSAYPASLSFRLQGERDVPTFFEESIRAGAPAELYKDVKVSGPLASFEAADTWIPHPYSNNLVLIGDAAAANDPSWGQGLSITLRDARVLRDRLLDTEDWDAACHDYAAEHDRHYGVIHEVTQAFKDMFMRSGAEADARRARALPLMASDPMRVPDHLFGGPDLPWDDTVRRTFMAEA